MSCLHPSRPLIQTSHLVKVSLPNISVFGVPVTFRGIVGCSLLLHRAGALTLRPLLRVLDDLPRDPS